MKKQTLGEMISTLRKEQGMTQAELAKKMNITDKAVSKWERDLSCPDINSLPKLAEIFHLSVDDLLDAKEHSDNDSTAERVGAVISLVIKAIAPAMGVGVTVLSILGQLEANAAFTMLGIGLTCAGISLFQKPGGKP